MSPILASHAGGSSIGMKMFEMNDNGRIVALATADAELADGTSPATAIPSAANAATPTMNVTAAAGILPASTSRS